MPRGFAAVLAAVVPQAVLAQITFANTSPGRPFKVEDAAAIDRRLLDLSIASAGLQRDAGRSSWFATPGLAYGLAARTEVEIRLPVSLTDASPVSRAGLAGASLSLMYALNVETRTLPAFAIRAGVLMPVGSVGPAEAHESVRGMVTRTFPWGRAHFNHEYTFGSEPATSPALPGLSRWTSGIAVDRAFPRHGLLLGAEGLARRRIVDSSDVLWDVRAGGRYQLTRHVAVDATLTRTIGDGEAWGVALGIGIARGLASLLPGLGRWGP